MFRFFEKRVWIGVYWDVERHPGVIVVEINLFALNRLLYCNRPLCKNFGENFERQGNVVDCACRASVPGSSGTATGGWVGFATSRSSIEQPNILAIWLNSDALGSTLLFSQRQTL